MNISKKEEIIYQEKMTVKRLRKNNTAMVLNRLYIKNNIYPSYISEHNSNHRKQIILSMIPNREGWYYLAVKKLSALLGGIT